MTKKPRGRQRSSILRLLGAIRRLTFLHVGFIIFFKNVGPLKKRF